MVKYLEGTTITRTGEKIPRSGTDMIESILGIKYEDQTSLQEKEEEREEEGYSSMITPIPLIFRIFRISALVAICLSLFLLVFGISVYIVLITLLGGIGWLITAQADITDWNARFGK